MLLLFLIVGPKLIPCSVSLSGFGSSHPPYQRLVAVPGPWPKGSRPGGLPRRDQVDTIQPNGQLRLSSCCLGPKVLVCLAILSPVGRRDPTWS